MKLPTENRYLEAFQEWVVMKYKLYNSLFLTLPFAHLMEVGIELPVFNELCRVELHKGKTPEEIVKYFFADIVHTHDFKKQIDILMLMLQFVERQIVLFDSLEDAAFKATHDMTGPGSLNQLIGQAMTENKLAEVNELLKTYRTRIVLTAHPTQFYPPQVLNIIHDLTSTVQKNEVKEINDLLLQLGMTPFKREEKPTPIDEAEIIIQYLENIFYPVLKNIHFALSQTLMPWLANNQLPAIIELGFWPGGDRDGNPNVTPMITLEVARKLKASILNIYIQEIKELQHRLTFRGTSEQLEKIGQRLQITWYETTSNCVQEDSAYPNCEDFEKDLKKIRKSIIQEHQGLFVEKVDQLIGAVQTFGFHFAAMDLRQDSHIHQIVLEKVLDGLKKTKQMSKNLTNYGAMQEPQKLELLESFIKQPKLPAFKKIIPQLQKNDLLIADVFGSLQAAATIQKQNGEKGLQRYIISHTESASDILEIILFAEWSGWPCKKLTLDIVPLFETIQDLKNADAIMRALYENSIYKKYLQRRQNKQTIMLGFSDGTKDGGYVTSNWEIFKCKKRLSDLAKKYGVTVIFFDGRGGPPARGGGNTHQFYRAIENMVKQQQIQLTIQGQSISTMYGTKTSATYNIEQLFTSGLHSELFPDPNNTISESEYSLLEELSNLSYQAYTELKNNPLFTSYLEKITPLKYYGELNIASRPPRRTQTGPMKLDDLRAIPFVGSWSQMRQNIPGFYGLGTALKTMIDRGEIKALKHLYQHSLFFRTLIENAMQTLDKTFFELTHYLQENKEFGEFWQILYNEKELTVTLLKKISGQKQLLENEPVSQQSIKNREEIVLPLLVIQQYALMMLRQGKIPKAKKDIFEKIILKSLAANINASRESA